MLIDWFTIVAQIINFLILLFLLRRFLYKPILKAMSDREQMITLRLREAERSKQEADRESAEYRRLAEELRNQREQRIEEAEIEAENRHRDLMHEARRAVDQAQAAWYRALEQEKEALLDELNRRAGLETVAIARKALADLANEDLQEQIVEVFTRRIYEMDDEQRRKLTDSVRQSGEATLVRSAFELSPELQVKIERAVCQATSCDSELRFEIDPDLVCGLEVKSREQKVAWNLASYLESLEDSIMEAFRERESINGRFEQAA